MAELVIPNLSPIGWIPGETIGVEGGIEQYLPGGSSERTTLRDVVDEFEVDNTGVTDVSTPLNAITLSLNNNEVLYFPYGLYLFENGVYLYSKQITVRGAGEGVLSTSSVTVGTGAKVFTVPADLGWTAGIGIRIWHAQDRYIWMQGTVTSYSGTTLTVDVNETSGDDDTLAFWTVGQTTMLVEGGGLWGYAGGDASVGTSLVLDSPQAGDTVITIDNSACISAPSYLTCLQVGYCKIDMLPEVNGEFYHHQPDPRAPYRQLNYILDVTGDQVTLARPLIMDLPSGRVPKIYGSQGQMRNTGHEYYAAFGAGTAPAIPLFLSFAGIYNSWVYHCQFGIADSYNLGFKDSVGCEMAYCFVGDTHSAEQAPSASAISFGGTNYFLMRHCIVKNALVSEGGADYNTAYLYNIEITYQWTLNHGAGSRFRVWEGNIALWMHSDGYHGGSSEITIFKNWIRGGGNSGPYGLVIQNRYNRRNNVVGNVLGWTGYSVGLHSMGNPNGGNGANDGTTVYPALYVSSGGASGSQFLHDNPTGDSRLTGVIASQDGLEVTITLDSPNTYENALCDPQVFGGYNDPFHVVWGSGDSTHYRQNCGLIRASCSGATVVLDGDLPISGGDSFPANGTSVAIKCGEFGHQEFDGSVEATSFNKENYQYGVDGAPGSITDPTADTLPDSLVYDAQPEDWPNSITWPPEISPDSPNVGDAVIPAQVRYLTGEWPAIGDPSVPVSVTPPEITGTAQVGSTLTRFVGTWTGVPTPTKTTQWLLCDAAGDNCENIVGETNSTYAPVTGDIGSTLRVTVTGTNSEGSDSATSAQTSVITSEPSSNLTSFDGSGSTTFTGSGSVTFA